MGCLLTIMFLNESNKIHKIAKEVNHVEENIYFSSSKFVFPGIVSISSTSFLLS